jgi:hypothetical protein
MALTPRQKLDRRRAAARRQAEAAELRRLKKKMDKIASDPELMAERALRSKGSNLRAYRNRQDHYVGNGNQN